VRETLQAVRTVFHPERVWAIYEPRSATSRRNIFQREIAEALSLADCIALPELFKPEKVPGSERLDEIQLVQDLRDMGRAAWNLGDVAGIIQKVCEESRAGDLIVIMSNGGFGGIYEKLPGRPLQTIAGDRMHRIRITALLLLVLSGAVLLRGQQQSRQPEAAGKDQEGFKIGVEVNMVTVPITVRKQEGGFLKGLPKDAFHVYEDGEPQEIVFFAQEGLPARIAIVLDSSGSVRTEWGTIKFATKKFVDNLKQDDEFSIISFNTDIRLKMDWGRKTDRIDSVLSSIYCKDNTKLWDAVWVVSNEVFRNVQQKKAMIIMSDGLDNDSSVSYKEALEAAVRSEAAIYVVSKTEAVKAMMQSQNQVIYNTIPPQLFVEADVALRQLAYQTGGRVLYPNNFGQLNNVYAEVDEELRNQYTVGYISSNTIKDGSYRRIEVRVDTRGAVASSRPGYYAPDERKSSPRTKI
jgi:Ca-activated chloride channel family protein